MARSKDVRTWTTVDPKTLHQSAQEAYEKLRQANDVQKAARKHLERIVSETADLPDTHRFVFAYQGGGFSVAVVEFKRRRPSSKPVHFDRLKAQIQKRKP